MVHDENIVNDIGTSGQNMSGHNLIVKKFEFLLIFSVNKPVICCCAFLASNVQAAYAENPETFVKNTTINSELKNMAESGISQIWIPNFLKGSKWAVDVIKDRDRIFSFKSVLKSAWNATPLIKKYLGSANKLDPVFVSTKKLLDSIAEKTPAFSDHALAKGSETELAQSAVLTKSSKVLGIAGNVVGGFGAAAEVLNDVNHKNFVGADYAAAEGLAAYVSGATAAVEVAKSTIQAVTDISTAVASGNRGDLIKALQSTDAAITRGAASAAGGLLGGGNGADHGNSVAGAALGAAQVIGNWIGENTWQSSAMQYLAFSADERAAHAANQAANEARAGELAAKRARDLQQTMANITASPESARAISRTATIPDPGLPTSKLQFGTQSQLPRASTALTTGTAMRSALPAPAALARIGAGSGGGNGVLPPTPVTPPGKLLFNFKDAKATASGAKALPSVLNQAAPPSGTAAASLSGKTGQTGLQPKLPLPNGKVSAPAGPAVIAQKPSAPLPGPMLSAGNHGTTNVAQQAATATPFNIRKPHTPNAVIAAPMMIPAPVKSLSKGNAAAAPLPSPVGAFQEPAKPKLRVHAAVQPNGAPSLSGNGAQPVHRPAGQVKTAAPTYQTSPAAIARAQPQTFRPQPALPTPQIVRQIPTTPVRQAAPVQAQRAVAPVAVLRSPAQVFYPPQNFQRPAPHVFQPNYVPAAQPRPVLCKLLHKC